MIDSGYTLKNGTKLYYVINDDGFDIYAGKSAKHPYLHQYEPYIPNPDISYENNAIQMCDELAQTSRTVSPTVVSIPEEEYLSLRADIDYLMVLNDGGMI